MKTRLFFIPLMLMLGCLASQAIAGSDIYKLVDKDGNITFTNRKIPNAEKISLAAYSQSPSTNKSAKPASQVGTVTSTERSSMRRKILESELLTEQQLFNDAQTSLDQTAHIPSTETSQQKVVQLKNKLYMHQRNIAALKKELGRF